VHSQSLRGKSDCVLAVRRPKLVTIGVASYGALGHVPSSTSNYLFFLITSDFSEPQKHWRAR